MRLVAVRRHARTDSNHNRDRYHRLTVRREGEDLIQYLRLRFDNESSEVVMNGAGQPEGNTEAESDEGRGRACFLKALCS